VWVCVGVWVCVCVCVGVCYGSICCSISALCMCICAQVLKQYHPLAMRWFLVTTHYRAPVNYSSQTLDEASSRLYYIYQSLLEAHAALVAAGKQQTMRLVCCLLCQPCCADDSTAVLLSSQKRRMLYLQPCLGMRALFGNSPCVKVLLQFCLTQYRGSL
jgi:hypothetical protein